ncbi:hypothetical protein RUND412_009650 [Rhizina undulata]
MKSFTSLVRQRAQPSTCLSCTFNHPRSHRRLNSSKPYTPRQAQPLHGYYKLLLENPIHPANVLPPCASRPPTSTPPKEAFETQKAGTAYDREESIEKARVVFGSRLASPIKRQEDKDRKAMIVAGVKIPPKPEEPDNCCQSGCVNCVFNDFLDDLEEWKAAKKLAAKRLKEQQQKQRATATSMDDDGGMPVGDEDLWTGFEDIPVGLRVFMETEKRLKKQQGHEGVKMKE